MFVSTVVLLQCTKKKKADDPVTPSMRTIESVPPVAMPRASSAAVAPIKTISTTQKQPAENNEASPETNVAPKNEKKEGDEAKSTPEDNAAGDKKGADEKKASEEEGYEACPELTPEQLLKIAEATPNK
ncbi:unnamed protein product [Toxocara canis]|uniref:Secreted protein n=1 Tax=Toxocara canis TaxID=6265 RepID=A0A183V5M3_TOXCA|nr:unnamed protein product [Toxocara canis]